jgi:hypothetical protein
MQIPAPIPSAITTDRTRTPRLPVIDRSLPSWTLGAMALGAGLGEVPTRHGEWLDRVRVADVSRPIALVSLFRYRRDPLLPAAGEPVVTPTTSAVRRLA